MSAGNKQGITKVAFSDAAAESHITLELRFHPCCTRGAEMRNLCLLTILCRFIKGLNLSSEVVLLD